MGKPSTRAFAATSILGLAVCSASCSSALTPSPTPVTPSLAPLLAAIESRVAERFAAELAHRVPEDEPLAVEEAEPDEGDMEDVWGAVAAHARPEDLLTDDAGADLDDDALAPSPGEREASPEPPPGSPKLVSIARETWVYDAPKRKARRIGYLRAGAVVARKQKPAGYAGCKGGFYEIEPRGYVCLGRSASLDPEHPLVGAMATRPKRDGLPYDYVMGRTPGPPFYVRLPSAAEQAKVEPDLSYFKKKLKGIEADPAFVPLPEAGTIPASLLGGKQLPAFSDVPPRGPDALTAGQAGVRSGFALLSQFEHEGRRFGLTADLAAIPLDRTRWVKPTTFQGVRLAEELTLPIGFVMKKKATTYEAEPTGRFQATSPLGYRQALGLTGKKDRGYLETRDGSWVKADDVRVVEPMSRAPTWASGKRKWIDVSILNQSLVAYEGTKPVYVTLVSTGADGLGDPKTTHSTVQGVFLIHTKHVTTTMDGDEAGDEFDLRDVPFVQYFTEGYALHAAYWHDDFGRPRSHGCVNLAPRDAAWLFGWTTPDVPETWHAALSLKHGTLIYTHP
ncbi:MAG: L,D-transpeptidase [Polyangiaceae bacterium]|nr:L,D-transpeptidase [Polyangiaceae bacterium]